MSASRRRELLGAVGLGGLAAVAAAGLARPDQPAIPAQASPDAELITLCGCFNDLERQIIATFGSLGDEDAEDVLREPLQEAQQPLFARIMDLRATTIAGHQARADMLRLWHDQVEADGRPDGYWAGRMTWALVRDVLGEAA